MSSVRCVAIAALVLGCSSCTCRGPSLSGNHGELLVVLPGADGGELLVRDAVFSVPGVAMGDVGQSPVVLRNVGTATVTITSATRDGESVFALSGVEGQAVEPSAELTGTLTFSPPQEADPTVRSAAHQASFQLALQGTTADESTASLTLTGEGLARDCYVPATLDFGAVPPGTRVSIPLVLANGKPAASTTTLGEVQGADASAFGHDQSSVDVAPGATVDAPVWFAPTEERSYQASFVVSRGAGCASATVTLKGRGLATAISWAPTSLDFGKLPMSTTSRELSVTVTNQSNAVLEVGGLLASPADFVLTASPTTVPAGGSAVISLRCKPSMLGKLTGTLSFSLDTTPALAASVALKCQGGGPKILVTPTNLSMGSSAFLGPGVVSSIRRISVQNVGTPPPSAGDVSNNLLLGNNGKPPLLSVVPGLNTASSEFELTVPSTYDAAKGVPAVLGSNSVDLEVRFRPQSQGQKDADVLVYSNDALTPMVQVHVSATATGADGCSGVTFDPVALAFGDTPRGSVVNGSVTVTNLGSEPCLLSGLDLTAGTSSVFSLLSPGQLSVPGNGQAVFSVHLTVPSSAAQGTRYHGYVRLWTSASVDPQLIPLDARVTTCFVAAPTALSFGATGLSCRSASRPLQLYDACSSPVTLVSIDGVTGPFKVLSAPDIPDGGLPLTTSPATISTAFVPDATGAVTGTLRLTVSEAGIARSESVPLDGLGTATSATSDSWTQGQGDVDILFVVDDSCSMADEQAALVTNFKYFIQHAQLTHSNFHLGVTTTDIFAVDGAMKGNPAFLTPATTNLQAEFSARALVGTGGSGFEQPFEGLLRAVTPPQSTSTNAGFLRDGVPLAAVIVTDAVEQSPKPVSTYLAQLLAVKGNRGDLLNVSVVGPFTQPTGCSLDSTIDSGRYLQLINATHGSQGDICTADWAKDLDTIGKNVLGLSTRFPLSATPGGAITITIDGTPVSGWTYDATSGTIVFSAAPPQGSVIRASYQTVCLTP